MKILMVTPSYYPIIGGCEISVRYLSLELKKQGFDTDVMTYTMDKKWIPKWEFETKIVNSLTILRIPGWTPPKLINIGIKRFTNIHAFPQPGFQRFFDDYDIIHFNDDVDLSFPFFSMLCNKPKIMHYRTFTRSFERVYKKSYLSRKILKKIADLHICNSNASANDLENIIGARKIRVIPNGVDLLKFKFTTDKNENDLLFVAARLNYEKGIDILYYAMKELNRKITLHVVGPFTPNKYIHGLRNLSNYKKRIIFHDRLEHNKLIKLYQKSAIFLCPSRIEPFGITNIESMACGTPVIASNTGGIPDIIRDGKDGILIPEGNSEKLVEAINYILDNPKIRATFGKNARSRVEERFSWEKVAKCLIKIYIELLETHVLS